MAAQKDYYSIIGVPPTATYAEIRYAASYKWFCLNKNPRSADAKLKLQLLPEAWGVLKDDMKRAAYEAGYFAACQTWQSLCGRTTINVSGLPTPNEPQPEPPNSSFAISTTEAQSQNPNLHPPPPPTHVSTAPRRDHHITLGRWKAKASFEYRMGIYRWYGNAQRLYAALATNNNEDRLLLMSLNTLRSMFEQEEFKALKRCITEVEAIVPDGYYARISDFTSVRSREQWTQLRRLEDHTKGMLELEIQDAKNFCLTSWSHPAYILTKNDPLEGYNCMRCGQWMGTGWKCSSCEFVFCVSCRESIKLLCRYYLWLIGKAENIWFGVGGT
jgi:curved DNA-binding protein CbpA